MKLVSFTLNEKESEAARAFESRHSAKHSKKGGPFWSGAIGGATTYRLTPTGIGTAVTIHCGACRKKKNITDYDAW